MNGRPDMEGSRLCLGNSLDVYEEELEAALQERGQPRWRHRFLQVTDDLCARWNGWSFSDGSAHVRAG